MQLRRKNVSKSCMHNEIHINFYDMLNISSLWNLFLAVLKMFGH